MFIKIITSILGITGYQKNKQPKVSVAPVDISYEGNTLALLEFARFFLTFVLLSVLGFLVITSLLVILEKKNLDVFVSSFEEAKVNTESFSKLDFQETLEKGEQLFSEIEPLPSGKIVAERWKQLIDIFNYVTVVQTAFYQTGDQLSVLLVLAFDVSNQYIREKLQISMSELKETGFSVSSFDWGGKVSKGMVLEIKNDTAFVNINKGGIEEKK